MKLLIVTGMSGSGKSSVMDVMEDIGYYCLSWKKRKRTNE